MNINKNKFAIILITILVAGFAGGFYFHQNYTGITVPLKEIINREKDMPQGVDFSIFWETWDLIQTRYVDKDKLDTQELVYGALDGLVKSVGDPYTVFLRPKESQSFAQEIQGTFGGIGIEIGLRDNVLTVIAPINGTPAEKSGILAGDKILKIGDKSTEGIKINEAVELIRGPKGTPVRLTINRESFSTSKEITIFRDTIRIPTVSWKLIDNNTAYVQLFVFNRNVDADFKKIAREIVSSKADRIILDLRNNPGGLLDSSVNIASYFLEPNQLVTEERFSDGKVDEFRTPANGQLKNYPITIIINKGSASASEILAGAIKDNRGVTIVGEKSFGKGSVQEVDELPGRAAVKITIAKWFTPKGVSIDDSGIEPDIEVERTEEDINTDRDPQLDKALEVVKAL